jgi:regulator of protease activity HflC (stomatin/prohibitin superfamily)
MARSEEPLELNPYRIYFKIVKWMTIIIFLLIIFFSTVYTIQAGERGVLLTFGKADLTPKGEGIHFKIPFVQTITTMEIRTVKYEADASSASSDLQTVHTKIAVNYHLVPESVVSVFTNTGLDYSERLINPAVQESVKASTAKFTAEELITKRELVREEIETLLREKLKDRGLIIEAVSITNFDFSEEFNKAIENKVVSQQNLLKSSIDLERIKVEAEQKVTSAKAEAESLRIQSEALKQNKDILQLRAIEKWDGKLPSVTGGAIPFIDINKLNQTQ